MAAPEQLAILRATYPNAIEVSARTGAGIDKLQEEIAQRLPRPQVLVDVVLPHSAGKMLSEAHEDGEVISEEWVQEGIHLVAKVHPNLAARLAHAQNRPQ